MNTVLQICAFLSPFVSAYLVYLLSIRGKIKDTDFQRERDINTVLSNLLMVWHYMSKLEEMIHLIKDQDSISIVPLRVYPLLILKGGHFNELCFQELDESVCILKKYDPFLFIQLEGMGNSCNVIRQRFIMPFFENPNVEVEQIVAGASIVLQPMLTDLVDYLKLVASKINDKSTRRQVYNSISHRQNGNRRTIEDMNKQWYELMREAWPDTVGKMNYQEFSEFGKSNEYKEMAETQFHIMFNNGVNDFLDFVTSNPDIPIEDLRLEFNKRQKGSGND